MENALCSFCENSAHEVRTMIKSPEGQAIICDECVVNTMRAVAMASKQLNVRFAFWAFEAATKIGYELDRLISEASCERQNDDAATPGTIDASRHVEVVLLGRTCSFCGRSEKNVRTLVGPGREGAFICDRCAISALSTLCRKPTARQLNMRLAFSVFSIIFNLGHIGSRLIHLRVH
jgi:ATP-dependent protease Clp ATPase subunit